MRLFIALPLPEDIEEALSKTIFAFKQKGGKVKWVAPKNIHLTLKFLGEVGEDRVVKIKSALDDIAQKYPPISTSVNKIGAFPNLGRPKIIWAGLEGETDRMEKIAGEIENTMEKLGFEKENRRFKPHLTLGRIKDSRGMEELTDYLKNYSLDPMPLSIDRIVLFKSTLMPRGPIYDRLHEAMLNPLS